MLEEPSWKVGASIAFLLFESGRGSHRKGINLCSLEDIWIFFLFVVLFVDGALLTCIPFSHGLHHYLALGLLISVSFAIHIFCFFLAANIALFRHDYDDFLCKFFLGG